MIIQVGGLAKEFPTITALPRPFSSVDSLVLVKRVLATERFPTFVALIKLFPIRGFWLVNDCLLLTGRLPTVS